MHSVSVSNLLFSKVFRLKGITVKIQAIQYTTLLPFWLVQRHHKNLLEQVQEETQFYAFYIDMWKHKFCSRFPRPLDRFQLNWSKTTVVNKLYLHYNLLSKTLLLSWLIILAKMSRKRLRRRSITAITSAGVLRWGGPHLFCCPHLNTRNYELRVFAEHTLPSAAECCLAWNLLWKEGSS